MPSPRSQHIETLDKNWISQSVVKVFRRSVKVMGFTNLYTKKDTCVFPKRYICLRVRLTYLLRACARP